MVNIEKTQRPSADATRMKIVKAARKLFLEKGFDGASIQGIAQLAGVNKNLVFHHYQNKASLWGEVKRDVIGAENDHYVFDISSPQAYFKSLIKHRFQVYEENPDLARLLAWQQVSHEQDVLTGTAANRLEKWLKPLIDFQSQGKLRIDIDPQVMLLFIIYGTYAPFLQNVMVLTQAQKKQYQRIVLNSCIQEFIV